LRIVHTLEYALRRFFADKCPRDSAAIAYRVLFSAGPLAIVIVSIFGLILQDDDVRQEVVETVVRGLPVTAAGRRDVENALATIATPASAAGLISLVLFAWTASGMMRAIRQGLETAMQVVETRSMSRGKLVDALLVAGAGALILVSVTITVLGDLLRGVLGDRIGDVGRTDTLVGGASRAVAIAVSIGVVLLLYRFVPARGLRVRDGLVGAIVTAVLLQLISLASGWIAVRTSKLSFIYGSLTAALFFVYSIYLYSAALLFGAEVASMWAHPLEAPITPLRRRMTVSALKTALREARRLT
jgi:membrane protein